MKSLIKKGAVMVVLLTTLQSYATEMPSLGDRIENETTVLSILNIKQGNQFFIKDLEGSVLYEEKISDTEEFQNRFNLSFLPDGEYVIELTKSSEIVTLPVEMIDNQVVYDIKSSYVKSLKSTRKKREKLFELERGIPRRTPSFKGSDFLNYYNLKK